MFALPVHTMTNALEFRGGFHAHGTEFVAAARLSCTGVKERLRARSDGILRSQGRMGRSVNMPAPTFDSSTRRAICIAREADDGIRGNAL